MSLFNRKTSLPISIHNGRNPFLSMQQELDKLTTEFGSFFTPINLPTELKENFDLSPSIDIVEQKDSFKVVAEMPGMGKEDIKLCIVNGMLSIKGEKSTAKKDKGKDYVMREICYGSYHRNIALPEYVDIDKAEASFKKGMLWVTIPKTAESAKKSKNIEVKEEK